MSVKFEDRYIKSKIRNTFGEIEVYNPIDKAIYFQLSQMIQNNSQQVQLENGKSDIEVTNTIQIMRYMIINLTNIENENYWNSIDDIKLEEILNLADGDFKKVINSLLDIMIEIGNDISVENRRKLDILSNKLNEMAESIKANVGIDKSLANFGLDREKLIKLQNGDEEVIEEFQQNIIKQSSKQKSKRGRPKKINK